MHLWYVAADADEYRFEGRDSGGHCADLAGDAGAGSAAGDDGAVVAGEEEVVGGWAEMGRYPLASCVDRN